jgi:hypothetical protein
VGSRASFACVAALAALLALPAGAAAATVAASSIVADLRRDRPVVLTGAVVRGPLDLRAAGTVLRLFKCRDCRLARW